MHTVVEAPIFLKQIAALLTEEEHFRLIDVLATDPLAGDEIPGTGGVRKIRFGSKGRGKRGGARVIYYFYNSRAPVYALLAYGKNEKTDLTPQEAKAVSAFVKEIKAMYGSKV